MLDTCCCLIRMHPFALLAVQHARLLSLLGPFCTVYYGKLKEAGGFDHTNDCISPAPTFLVVSAHDGWLALSFRLPCRRVVWEDLASLLSTCNLCFVTRIDRDDDSAARLYYRRGSLYRPCFSLALLFFLLFCWQTRLGLWKFWFFHASPSVP